MTPWVSRRAWLALATLAAASPQAAEATCADTGELAPDGFMVMAATTNPASEAWMVGSDCSIERIPLVTKDGDKVLDLSGYTSQHVRSVPSEATVIIAIGSSLYRGGDFSMATKARRVELSRAPPDPRTLLLPPSLESIYFAETRYLSLVSLDGIELPATLKSFEVQGSQLKYLTGVQFPASLETISIANSPLQTIDFQLPAALKVLQFNAISASSFGVFEQLTLPSGLEIFQVRGSPSATINGIRWPSTLKEFDFQDTKITAFEIRQSDVVTFEKLSVFKATVTQAACSSSAAKLQTVAGVSLCVLPDASFDNIYGPPSTLAPVPTSKTTKAPKATSSPADPPAESIDDDDEASSDTAFDSETPTRRTSAPRGESPADTTSTTLDQPDDDPLADEESPPDDVWNTRSTTTRSPSMASNATGSPSGGSRNQTSPIVSGSRRGTSSTSLAIILLACALSFVVGGIIYHAQMRARQRRQQEPKPVVDDSTMGSSYTVVKTPAL